MSSIQHRIAANLQGVETRLAAACARAGRDPSSVRLVAVTKSARPDWVRALVELGVTELGESRPQQLVERAAAFGPSVRWHLIGPLQRNKARRVLPLAALIHSVDSFRLLETLERLSAELDLRPRVLLEANVAGETQKHGFTPAELLNGWKQCAACRRVEIAGLMAMAAYADNPQAARPAFAALRELRDRLRNESTAPALPELSMGMSGDFEVAIEEGATIVRVGSSLFEGLAA